MPLTAAKIALPKSVAVATVSKAKDTSTIAQLSPSEPQLFLDKEYITFDGAAEAEVVDEGAVKGSYEQELGSVTAKRVKLVVTTRVTNELQWADDDAKLQIVSRIQDNQAEALAVPWTTSCTMRSTRRPGPRSPATRSSPIPRLRSPMTPRAMCRRTSTASPMP